MKELHIIQKEITDGSRVVYAASFLKSCQIHDATIANMQGTVSQSNPFGVVVNWDDGNSCAVLRSNLWIADKKHLEPA